jgi:predicted nucleic acid-binding protein
MASKGIVIVDTDILIKVYRGDEIKREQLEKLSGKVALSIITVWN